MMERDRKGQRVRGLQEKKLRIQSKEKKREDEDMQL